MAGSAVQYRPDEQSSPVGLWALAVYFVRLGALGFGGPIALTATMRRDLVEDRHWISDSEYREGLALAQLAPGPLAAQLAMYLGWSASAFSGQLSWPRALSHHHS